MTICLEAKPVFSVSPLTLELHWWHARYQYFIDPSFFFFHPAQILNRLHAWLSNKMISPITWCRPILNARLCFGSHNEAIHLSWMWSVSIFEIHVFFWLWTNIAHFEGEFLLMGKKDSFNCFFFSSC